MGLAFCACVAPAAASIWVRSACCLLCRDAEDAEKLAWTTAGKAVTQEEVLTAAVKGNSFPKFPLSLMPKITWFTTKTHMSLLHLK